MAGDASTARLLSRYGDAARLIRSTVDRFVAGQWEALDAYHEADVARFAARVAPTVTGAQARMASMTDAYIAAVATARVGSTRPVGVPAKLVTDEAMRGVAALDVYKRAGPTVWRSLAGGADLTTAARAGGARAQAMAATDLQLARTHAARYVLDRTDAPVSGYIRVPAGDCCDLCALAADNHYSTGDLMPIHNRCSCDVEPAFDGQRPGRAATVSDERLAAVTVDGVEVQEHGELGPVLTVAGQHFTGPDDF